MFTLSRVLRSVLWRLLYILLFLLALLHSVRFGDFCPLVGIPLWTDWDGGGACGTRGGWALGPWTRGAAARTLGLASAAAGGSGCAWWLLYTVLLGSHGGLAIIFCGSVWWIVLCFCRGGLLWLADWAAGTAWSLGAGNCGLHLGDCLHRLCGGARGLVQTEVLIRRLLLLPNGRQLWLGEDVLGYRALGAAWGRAAAAVGPRLPQTLLWVLLLRGVSFGWKRLQVTDNMTDKQWDRGKSLRSKIIQHV